MPEGLISRLTNQQRAVAVAKLAGLGLVTTGKIFMVKASDDVDYNDVRETFPANEFYTTLATAVAACRSGPGDVVLLSLKDGADVEPWTITANLDLAKTNMKLIGAVPIGALVRPIINIATAVAVRIGQGATDGARVYGVELGNIGVVGSGVSVVTPVQISDVDCYGTYIHHCEIANAGTTAAVSALSDLGKSLLVRDSVLGYLKAAVSAAGTSYKVYAQGTAAGIIGINFDNVTFKHWSLNTADVFADIVTGAKDVEFNNCRFINGNFAAASGAITMAAVATFADAGFTTAVPGAANRFFGCQSNGATIFAAAGKGHVSPTIKGAAIQNPGIAINASAVIAA
ncbi:MAG: hypothetical protein ACKV2Q_36485 [Planctomycetaceae bacterium]